MTPVVQGVLVRVCAWCQADMGTKPCDPGCEGVTHGICPACADAMGSKRRAAVAAPVLVAISPAVRA